MEPVLSVSSFNTSKQVLFLPPSDVYVRSFLYLLYTLIKLYYTKVLSDQASSLTPDWIPFLQRPRIPASLHDSATNLSVFPILLLSSISLHWSLGKVFLSLLAILWNSALKWVYLSFSPLPFTSLIFSAICKASSDNHFAFLHFFFLGMVLITASCIMSQTSIYSSSGTLSIRSNTLNLFVTSTV